MKRKMVCALVAAPVLLLGSSHTAHAFAVYGDILKIYQAEGGERGDLGPPTSDEQPFGSSGDRINYFKNGYILWWKSTTETLVHVNGLRFTYRIPAISFPGGDPVGAHGIVLTINSNGAYSFSGRFHSAATILNPVPEKTNIVVTVSTPRGTVLTFGNSGSVSAYSRDHNWHDAGNNPAIASRWSELESGGVVFNRSASTRLDFGAVFDVALKAISVVTTVIKIVG